MHKAVNHRAIRSTPAVAATAAGSAPSLATIQQHLAGDYVVDGVLVRLSSFATPLIMQPVPPVLESVQSTDFYRVA